MSKKILIAIPELSYSGSVYSSLRITKVLLSAGYEVSVCSYLKGDFDKEFLKIGIKPSVIDKDDIYWNPQLEEWLKKYDLFIANTIIVYALADIAKNIIPTIWYIREAQNLPWQFFASDYRRYCALKRAENIYAVSEYAASFISENYNPNVRVLHNCVEDVASDYKRTAALNHKIKFLALGTFEPRKAFDLMIDAFELLSVDSKDSCELHFAGRRMEYAKDYFIKVTDRIDNTENVFYHGEIKDREKVLQLMMDSDVIVVPSKDESCSLVALDAAMLSKPLILSTNIGASYLLDNDCGWIFETDNAASLADCYNDVIMSKNSLAIIGDKLRKKYEETSTFEIYSKNILQMVEDNMTDNIETYRVDHTDKMTLEEKQRIVESQNTTPIYVFSNIPQMDDDFIIYGAGNVGRCFQKICQERNLNPRSWIDKNKGNEGVIIDGIKIKAINEIEKYCECKIYVAIYQQDIFKNICDELITRGISAENIYWVSPQLIKR